MKKRIDKVPHKQKGGSHHHRPNKVAPLVTALRARTGRKYIDVLEAIRAELKWDLTQERFDHLFRRPFIRPGQRYDPVIVMALVRAYTQISGVPIPGGCTLAEAIEIFRCANLSHENGDYQPLADVFGQEALDHALERLSVKAPRLPGLMPAFPGTLTGREALLERVLKRLAGTGSTEESAFTVFYGLRGLGKSTVMGHLLHGQADLLAALFPDGVVWAQWGAGVGAVERADHFRRWLREMGAPLDPAVPLIAPADLLRAHCYRRRVLVVVEEVWTAEQFEALRALWTPGMALLMTTRFPMAVRRLPNASRFAVPPLTEAESLALLTEYAPEVVALDGLDLTGLVKLTGGIRALLTELGILLREAHHIGFSMERVVRRLSVDFGAPDGLGRPSVLENFFGTMVRSLGAQEQALLASIAGVWPEPTDIAPLIERLGVDADVLERSAWLLFGQSLIDAAGHGRFTVNPALAAYVNSLNKNLYRGH